MQTTETSNMAFVKSPRCNYCIRQNPHGIYKVSGYLAYKSRILLYVNSWLEYPRSTEPERWFYAHAFAPGFYLCLRISQLSQLLVASYTNLAG